MDIWSNPEFYMEYENRLPKAVFNSLITQPNYEEYAVPKQYSQDVRDLMDIELMAKLLQGTGREEMLADWLFKLRDAQSRNEQLPYLNQLFNTLTPTNRLMSY